MPQLARLRPCRRVVVTGLGAVSSVGLDAEETWRNLIAGISGAGQITQFDASCYPSTIACEVKGYKPPAFLDVKEARRMSRFILFALGCAEEALRRANLIIDERNHEDVGVLIGTTGSLTTMEKECRVMAARGGMRINPFFLPMMLPNMGSGQVSRILGIRGYSTGLVSACASGAQAIGEAAEVIRRGAAEVMVCGGSEASICEIGLSGFCVLRALSQRNDDPQRASRPFDLNRDGLVPAEGAAILVLESLEHALKRGAPIVAELVGYGVSSDAYHVVAPHPEGDGAALAIRRALEDAEISPNQVDYINAHATATTLGDISEALAIKRVFGERGATIPVSATKSMLGHAMAAAGALGALATVLAIRDGIVHPTINYETPDPKCDLDCVPNVARRLDVTTGVCNAFAFGGHNASLVFRRYYP